MYSYIVRCYSSRFFRARQRRHGCRRVLCFATALMSLVGLPFPASNAPATENEQGSEQLTEQLVDRIVAIVDGYPVLYSRVMDKVNKGPLVVVSNYPADDQAPPFEQALQDAVNFELLLAKAKELDIDVRGEEVEAEIKSFLEKRGLDRAGLQQHLDAQGLTYDDYKSDFRDQMILRNFQGRVIHPLVKVTDKDIETYYLKKSGDTSDLIELRLRQILIGINGNAAPEVVQAKQKLAEEVHQKLVGGMDFADAVKVYSDDERARESGGLMAAVRARDLAPQIRGEVEALEVGKFTPPIRTALGFHIFYLEEKQLVGTQEFTAQRRQLEFELKNLELNNQTRRWLTEQRQKSKVEFIRE